MNASHFRFLLSAVVAAFALVLGGCVAVDGPSGIYAVGVYDQGWGGPYPAGYGYYGSSYYNRGYYGNTYRASSAARPSYRPRWGPGPSHNVRPTSYNRPARAPQSAGRPAGNPGGRAPGGGNRR